MKGYNMAHLLDMTNGNAAMAYVGETPWHGLGNALQPGASIETWQEQAGMAWAIEQTPVQFNNGIADVMYPGSQVFFRSDNQHPLAIVSNKFKIVQPKEVLEFFRDVSGSVGYTLETAGCLDEGRKFWALARTGDSAFIGPKDAVNAYLLLATACDSSMNSIAQFTSVRVVCKNTLQMSLKGASGKSVKTSHRTVFDPCKVKQELGIYSDSWAAFITDAKRLANTPITNTAQVKQFLVSVFDGDPDAKMAEQPNKQAMEKTWELVNGSPGSDLPSANGTAWGLVNGVTRFVDFERRARSDNNRLDAAWFGAGATLKQKAMDAALALAA